MEASRKPAPGPGLIVLAGWIILSLAAGAVGAFASAGAPSFYGELVRPAWSPPPSLFGPVWTALYILMGIAAWLVWREEPSPATSRALRLFILQLALNALWTWVFFAWRLGALAFAWIGLLWVLILVITVLFWRIRPIAGALLLPYLAWVAFATGLTLALWRANPGLL